MITQKAKWQKIRRIICQFYKLSRAEHVAALLYKEGITYADYAAFLQREISLDVGYPDAQSIANAMRDLRLSRLLGDSK